MLLGQPDLQMNANGTLQNSDPRCSASSSPAVREFLLCGVAKFSDFFDFPLNFLHFPPVSPSHSSGFCWIYGFDRSVIVALGLRLLFCASEEAKPRARKNEGSDELEG
ncbi:hypothetical protein SLEP1_g54273 [Rubroshorea leprosula]|uniref:Uncharacterized protein n=1 Tax=Rubroshorea leprosula TaxID=152421 RepID=A0AAV5MCY0_9ROSI|nr:hypothetical protein SLEP1_g54273 [Rubroshorea leprosula]